jgi:hypothetical protein
MNNVRRDASRHYRNKKKKRRHIWNLTLRNLKLTVRLEISGTCTGASMTSGRVTA